MYETMIKKMIKKGYEIRVVPIDHLRELKIEIEMLYESDYLGKNISNFLKGFYDFNKPRTSYDIKSLIIVASPSPQVKVVFNFKSKKIPVLIPPTIMNSLKDLRKLRCCYKRYLVGKIFTFKELIVYQRNF